jgi:arginine deiminase
MADTKEVKFGVHSEVGQLRKVMVCAPGIAHTHLTPTNCDALFDDVLWVDAAKRDHFDFITKMRYRGVDVLEMHNLLAETVAVPEGKRWILDSQVEPNQVGLGLVDEIRSYLEGLEPRKLAETLLGGLSTEDFPEKFGGEMLELVKDAAGVTEYLLPPLPNTLYTRDTTCWIYGGVTINSLYWPARHEEPILRSDLQVPSGFCRQGECMVGRSDQGPRLGHVRRRRRDAYWKEQRPDRHERAHFPPGDQPSGGRTVREGSGAAGHRGRDA